MFSILGCSVRGKKISNKFCNMYNYFTLFHVDFQKLLQNVKLIWLEYYKQRNWSIDKGDHSSLDPYSKIKACSINVVANLITSVAIRLSSTGYSS